MNSSTDQYRLRPIVLKFADNSLENRFRAYHSERFMLQTRIGIGLGLLLYGGFFILDRYLTPASALYSAVIRLGIVVPYFGIWLALTYAGFFIKRMQLYIAIGIVIAGLGHFALQLLLPQLPDSYSMAVTIILVMFAFTFSGLRVWPALTTAVILLVPFEIIAMTDTKTSKATIIYQNFVLISMYLLGVLGGFIIERYVRNEFITNLVISQEKAKSENLLLNILPITIADRLKSGESAIADSFQQATILFADIVHFSSFCSDKPPSAVVSMLNDLFSLFDLLVDKYRLERIKTMGDCYILAGGLPIHRDDHAEAVAYCALDMRDALRLYRTRDGESISMRIGIHTGPVSAGIIGYKKFAYDVWGDTVNTASRLESSCQPDFIQASDAAYQALKAAFSFQERGQVCVEGLGDLTTYYLLGQLDGPLRSREPVSVAGGNR